MAQLLQNHTLAAALQEPVAPNQDHVDDVFFDELAPGVGFLGHDGHPAVQEGNNDLGLWLLAWWSAAVTSTFSFGFPTALALLSGPLAGWMDSFDTVGGRAVGWILSLVPSVGVWISLRLGWFLVRHQPFTWGAAGFAIFRVLRLYFLGLLFFGLFTGYTILSVVFLLLMFEARKFFFAALLFPLWAFVGYVGLVFVGAQCVLDLIILGNLPTPSVIGVTWARHFVIRPAGWGLLFLTRQRSWLPDFVLDGFHILGDFTRVCGDFVGFLDLVAGDAVGSLVDFFHLRYEAIILFARYVRAEDDINRGLTRLAERGEVPLDLQILFKTLWWPAEWYGHLSLNSLWTPDCFEFPWFAETHDERPRERSYMWLRLSLVFFMTPVLCFSRRAYRLGSAMFWVGLWFVTIASAAFGLWYVPTTVWTPGFMTCRVPRVKTKVRGFIGRFVNLLPDPVVKYWLWAHFSVIMTTKAKGDYIYLYRSVDGDMRKVDIRTSKLPDGPGEQRDMLARYLGRFSAGKEAAALTYLAILLLWASLLGTVQLVTGFLQEVTDIFGEIVAIGTLAYAVPDSILELFEDAAVMCWLRAWSEWVNFRTSTGPWLWEAVKHDLKLMVSYLVIMRSKIVHTGKPRPPTPELLGIWKTKLIADARVQGLRVVRYLDDFRLPETIEGFYRPPTVETLQESVDMLRAVGWPIEISFTKPTAEYAQEFSGYEPYRIASSTWRIARSYMKLAIAPEMERFGFSSYAGYLHSTTVTDPEAADIQATSRYWSEPPSRLFDPMFKAELVDDAWELVKAQYANSKLATPKEIIRGWNKRYNLGFGFSTTTKSGKPRQLRRGKFIKAYNDMMEDPEAFERLYTKTRDFAGKLTSIAPVFTKWETLKAKKISAGAIRTVIGSALGHDIFTKLWNYRPNHNYKPWQTPMKVGMSINGDTFGRLWSLVSTHQKVWAGDMTAFDSTVPPQIIEIVRELRKRGFKGREDYDRIAQLIDVAYAQLVTHPLGFKSMGEILGKNKGFTTGHSSTSTDNSLALVICYLFAWKRVTGLRAREFSRYNTLVNFGDDHLLGYDEVFNWTPANACRAMSELGIIMRDEGNGQDRLPDEDWTFDDFARVAATLPGESQGEKQLRLRTEFDLGIRSAIGFLSKLPVVRTPEINDELDRAGVHLRWQYATMHDRTRLLGKIKGQTGEADPLKRYVRLKSYLDLCAHQKDVYGAIRNAMQVIKAKHSRAFLVTKHRAVRKEPPSYEEVLQRWYNHESSVVSIDDTVEAALAEDETGANSVVVWGIPTTADDIVAALAGIPTVVSPRFINVTWLQLVHKRLAPTMCWALDLIKMRNPEGASTRGLERLISKTPYSFLSVSHMVWAHSGLSHPDLLLRHWIFNIVDMFVIGRSRRVTFLDALRSIDKLFSFIVYNLDGRVIETMFELDFQVLRNLLVLGLGLIPPLFPGFEGPLITPWSLRPPSIAFGALVTQVFSFFAPSGAIDFQPLDNAVRHLRSNEPFVMSAGTGVGKSTRMVVRIAEVSNERVVVIEPRHILVTSLAGYVGTFAGHLGVGAQTFGHKPADTDKLIYATFQSLVLTETPRDDTIYVVDEAHIQEPAVTLAIRWLQHHKARHILSTATPRGEWDLRLVHVPSANRFTVNTEARHVRDLSEYINEVVTGINGCHPEDRHLVFAPDVAHADRFYAEFGDSVTSVNSRNTTVDSRKRIYVATSVADAGLTIPDVSHVWSTDLTRSVTRTRGISLGFGDHAISSRLGKIDDYTRVQRRGRTGRTSNGTFHWFTTDVGEVIDMTPLDQIVSLGAALEYILDIVPDEINLVLAEAAEEAALFGSTTVDYVAGIDRNLREFAKGNPGGIFGHEALLEDAGFDPRGMQRVDALSGGSYVHVPLSTFQWTHILNSVLRNTAKMTDRAIDYFGLRGVYPPPEVMLEGLVSETQDTCTDADYRDDSETLMPRNDLDALMYRRQLGNPIIDQDGQQTFTSVWEPSTDHIDVMAMPPPEPVIEEVEADPAVPPPPPPPRRARLPVALEVAMTGDAGTRFHPEGEFAHAAAPIIAPRRTAASRRPKRAYVDTNAAAGPSGTN